jgi:xanthine dehydrogenase molybdopterin-binding subunit B
MNGLKVNLQVSANYAPKEGHVPGQVAGEFEKSPLPQGAYLSYGAAVSEVEVDILTGDVRALRSDILYDCGHSLNPLIDIGQAEGAFVFGQGFYMGEEIAVAPDGECLTKGTWQYKPTLATNIPRDFRVAFLKDSPYSAGVMRSKAVGEPPLILAYSMMAAARKAIADSREERGLSRVVKLDVPATCIRVFEAAEVTPQHLADSLQ